MIAISILAIEAKQNGSIKEYLNVSGGKGMDPLEGGIRIPGMIKWPGKIESKTKIDIPTSLVDFLPTVQEIVGFELKDKVYTGTPFFVNVTSRWRSELQSSLLQKCAQDL